MQKRVCTGVRMYVRMYVRYDGMVCSWRNERASEGKRGGGHKQISLRLSFPSRSRRQSSAHSQEALVAEEERALRALAPEPDGVRQCADRRRVTCIEGEQTDE